MRHCLCCGVERSDQHILGDLVLEDAPLAAFWKTKQIFLIPTYILILIKLVNHNLVSADDLRNIFEKTLSRGTLRVYLHRMKLALPKEVRIEAIYGQGYRLIIDNDPLSGLTNTPPKILTDSEVKEENSLLRKMLMDAMVENERMRSIINHL